MGRKLQYTTLDRILSKIYRDLGIEEISETDVIEWSGEALELIGAITLYEEAVAFIEIENYQADLPNGLHSIIQVARNNRWVKQEKELCPANIVLDCTTEEIKDTTNACGCGDKPYPEGSPIPLDCNGTPIIDYELAYYRPYFDLQYEYHGWMKSNLYQQEYTPVRLANHTFFNSIVCEEDPAIYCPSCNISDEYTIVGDKIRTSFKEGSIALAYYRQKVDPETGYPMVPDEVSVINAIFWFVAWKYNARMWMMGRDGYADKMKESEMQWHWYCKQAGNKQMMLYGIDEHENFKDSRFQLIPKNNRYYGYFGKLGKPENTNFKDPNRRNFRLRGI